MSFASWRCGPDTFIEGPVRLDLTRLDGARLLSVVVPPGRITGFDVQGRPPGFDDERREPEEHFLLSEAQIAAALASLPDDEARLRALELAGVCMKCGGFKAEGSLCPCACLKT